ncbi:MAG: inositol monophosphatase family protein, partial [Verrucomicrobiota bacterium]
MSKNDSPNLNDLLACAVEAARRAGDHAQSQSHRRHEVLQRFDHDVKLNLDREAQDKAEEVIQHHFPHHAILGEEGEVAGESGEWRWVIDPIDGTVNFAHQMPLWCSSVAIQKNKKSVAGAVYVPPLNEL